MEEPRARQYGHNGVSYPLPDRCATTLVCHLRAPSLFQGNLPQARAPLRSWPGGRSRGHGCRTPAPPDSDRVGRLRRPFFGVVDRSDLSVIGVQGNRPEPTEVGQVKVTTNLDLENVTDSAQVVRRVRRWPPRTAHHEIEGYLIGDDCPVVMLDRSLDALQQDPDPLSVRMTRSQQGSGLVLGRRPPRDLYGDPCRALVHNPPSPPESLGDWRLSACGHPSVLSGPGVPTPRSHGWVGVELRHVIPPPASRQVPARRRNVRVSQRASPVDDR